MTNKKKSVTISFNVTPEVAEALDHMVWIDSESRASYVRDLLVSDLRETTLLAYGTPTTPAMARARKTSLQRRAEA